MTESQIRKKAIEIFKENSWSYWFPKKVKYQETDIFGCFDCIVLNNGYPAFIQLTTISNISARKKKIENFLADRKFKAPCIIWGWNKKKKEFQKVIL